MDFSIILQRTHALNESFSPGEATVYRIEHTVERDQTVLRSANGGIGGVKINVKSSNEMAFLHALSP